MNETKAIKNRKWTAIVAIVIAFLMMISLSSVSAFALGESASNPYQYETRGVENYTEDDGNDITVYTFDYLNKTVYVYSSKYAYNSGLIKTEPLYDDGNDIVHFQLLNGKNLYVKYLSHNLY